MDRTGKKTEHSYVALIRKEQGTDYFSDIPDIPGCVSCGATEDEALLNFHDALEMHIESLDILPPPRSRDEVLAAEPDAYLKACIIRL